MIKKLLAAQNKSIIGAAIILGVASFVSRLVGIIRDRILANQFGASDVLDAYYAAFKIPDLLYALLIAGALSVGIIPIFTKVYQEHIGKKEAWKLISNIINITGLAISICIIILIIITPWLMPLIAPGFVGEKMKLAVLLTRIMFLSPLFLSLSAIVGSVLQSLKNFLIYSLSPIFYNLGIIFGAIFLVPAIGYSGLSWGVAIGALLHLIIQLPAFFKTGFHYSAILNFKNKHIRQIGRLMVPRVMALSALQINLIVITAIASTLTAGSVAIFNYANNLQSFPLGIIGVSFAMAAFPTLASLAVSGKKGELIKNFSSTVRQILFFIIPLSIIFLLLRAQIVRIVLGSGAFGWDATIKTADTLAFFAIGLFAQALLPLLIRAYYAFSDTKTPFLISLVAVVIDIALSIILTRGRYNLGVAGLALAYSIAGIINFSLLWIFLRFKTGSLDEERILTAIFKISAAGIFMALSVQGMKYLIAPVVDMQAFWGIFIQGLSASIAGAIIYILIGLLLKSHEMIVFVETIKKKFVRAKNLPVDISEIGKV